MTFTTSGDDTEIDRTLAETMADPLLHMVRNAVDHGIEAVEVRAKAGKPKSGMVRLEAFHAGDDVVIQMCDDGGGMDPQRLRRKAIEKGLIPADRQLSDQECFDLIFLPGFSTAAQVTDVSGRGVGMDVVRRQVTNANGRIQIQSMPGQGSTFTISLPLAEQALTELVPAVGQCAAGAVRIRLGIQMLARLDGTAAPRASGELIRGADPAAHKLIAASLLDRFHGIIGAVGRGATAHPQSARTGPRPTARPSPKSAAPRSSAQGS